MNRTDAYDPVEFFDRISGDYSSRYKGYNPFHRYYFGERLSKAIEGLDLTDSDVLDIGSGTGNLYDALLPLFPTMRFMASDASEGMLANSSVPADQRILGRIHEHSFGDRRFDAIFMLGVTTYLDQDELEKHLIFISEHLRNNGRFIVSFTNSRSFDAWTRNIAKLVVGHRPNGKEVLSSGIRTSQFSYREITRLMSPYFRIIRWSGLNHTIFPMNRLLAKPSLSVAKRLSMVQGAPAWLRLLSSDLLVQAELR